MPREIVHCTVLDLALPKLESLGLQHFSQALRQERAISYLGAVAHDAPYYYQGGGSKFEEIAERLHGTHGEDTFELLRPMLQMIKVSAGASVGQESDQQTILLAFWLGMLSHAATDIVFHPAIYYLTGDYYAKDAGERRMARISHRAYEAQLDQCVARKFAPKFAGKLFKVRKSAGNKLDLVIDFLDRQLVSKTGELAWRSAFAMQILSNRLGTNTLSAWAIRNLAKIYKSLEPIAALAYSAKRLNFTESFYFQNPVTGQRFQESIESLLEHSVNKFCHLCQLVNQNGLLGVKGESLNFGIVGADSSQARYFAA